MWSPILSLIIINQSLYLLKCKSKSVDNSETRTGKNEQKEVFWNVEEERGK